MSAQPNGSNKRLVLVAMIFAVAMTFIDQTIVALVVPQLQARGSYPTDYEPGTLRNKLFGRGDKLPENHKAAGFRLHNSLVR